MTRSSSTSRSRGRTVSLTRLSISEVEVHPETNDRPRRAVLAVADVHVIGAVVVDAGLWRGGIHAGADRVQLRHARGAGRDVAAPFDHRGHRRVEADRAHRPPE